MTTTTHYNIELLSSGQDQPEITLNDALMALDAAAAEAKALAQAGGGSGGADGTNRQYVIGAATTPDSTGDLSLWALDPPMPGRTYILHGAKTGDDLTVLIAADATGDSYSPIMLIIPTAFARGNIRVDSAYLGPVVLVTEASSGDYIYDIDYNLVPGAADVRAGFSEFALATSLIATDYGTTTYIPELVNVVPTVLGVESRDFHLSAPAVGDSVQAVFTSGIIGKRLAFNPQDNVRVLSDQPVSLKLELFAWDGATRSFSTTPSGSYTWTNTATGTPAYSSMHTDIALSTIEIPGQGTFRVPPFQFRMVATVTGFPGTPASFAEIAMHIRYTVV